MPRKKMGRPRWSPHELLRPDGLPPSLYEWLVEEAKRRDITLSELKRQVLQNFKNRVERNRRRPEEPTEPDE